MADPEQREIHKNTEPDLLFTMQTRQSSRVRFANKYNPYGDDFVVDRIDLRKLAEELVGLEETIITSWQVDIVDRQSEQ